MDLGQVGGELGLNVAPARDIRVGLHHVAPGAQARLGRQQRRLLGGRLTLGARGLLLELEAQQLLPDGVNRGGRLGRRDRLEQTARGVGDAVGLIVGEGALMRPVVARRDHLTGVGAPHVAQLIHEDLVPAPPHQVEAGGGIKARHQCRVILPGRVRDPRIAGGAQHRVDLAQGRLPVDLVVLARDEGRQPLLQRLDDASYTFSVAQSHTGAPLMLDTRFRIPAC